jgi:hypothetical protein
MAMCIVIVAWAAALGVAWGRDLGQWEAEDLGTKLWFQGLMQPDDPAKSCCGLADAYFADDFAVEGDNYVAIITDGREDEPLGRPHRPVGERHVIPANKIKFDKGNPTGHGILFIGQAGSIYCYLPPVQM